MTRSKWICREHEETEKDIVRDGVDRWNEIDKDPDRTTLFKQDTRSSPITQRRICDVGGEMALCFKRTGTFVEAVEGISQEEFSEALDLPPEVIAESVEDDGDVIVESILEEILEETEEALEEVSETIDEKEAQMAALIARIKALEDK